MTQQPQSWKEQRKQELRAIKAGLAGRPIAVVDPPRLDTTVHCACVIHGNVYTWDYVQRLYNMIQRNLSRPFQLHVYTEPERSVPDPFVKHSLEIWPGFEGPKKAWWYKIQVFNPAHHSGPLLYFDLDTVIVDNIDWITNLSSRYFWAIKEFKYLWRPTINTVNSSVMWWDTKNFSYVWQDFVQKNMVYLARQYRGDQDYISAKIPQKQRRFFDVERIWSWRWQALDGGYNFKRRTSNAPGTGTKIDSQCSVLIFHGQPKPHQVSDPMITQNWI